MPFKLPCLYERVIEFSGPKAYVAQNPENASVLCIGQGEVINGRIKRLKLDGGET